jgi:hypothetical protein
VASTMPESSVVPTLIRMGSFCLTWINSGRT